MMWHEFEELAGYEVSYKTYAEIIEPMYMALPDSINKQEFVKMLNRKVFALPTKREMLHEMKAIAEERKENCGHFTNHEAELRLEELAKAYAKRFYGVDWDDLDGYVYIHREYEYPTIERGCTYPKTLVIGRKYTDYARIELVKD